MKIKASELILNDDGSIYHLNLKKGQLSDTIITVGDQERVDKVAQYFDDIELTVAKREFKTITGKLNGKRLSVISTGIGTDNIDIVFNEIDALFNIDFEKREVVPNLKTLNFVRIGTSGALRDDVPLDSILLSAGAIGTEGLLNFYAFEPSAEMFQVKSDSPNMTPYYVAASQKLLTHFTTEETLLGTTVTANGFYGPQLRELRLKRIKEEWLDNLKTEGRFPHRVTNLEMETAGIYCMARLLGHSALSVNMILANRKMGTFTKDPKAAEDKLIKYCLEKIISLDNN